MDAELKDVDERIKQINASLKACLKWTAACDCPLSLILAGDTLIAAPRTVARVAPHATRLFAGVIVQALLGATYVGLLEASGGCRMVHVPPLDGLRIIDAIGAEGVVAVRARRGSKTLRITLRFAPDGRFDLHEEAVEPAAGLEMVVLATGVCVRRAGTTLTLFTRRPGDVTRKVIDAPELTGCRLIGRGAALGFVRDRVVGTLRMGPQRSAP